MTPSLLTRGASALTLIALLALPGCSGEDAAEGVSAAASVQAVPVRVKAAETANLVRTLELGGIAEAWRSARLAPMGQGRISKLPVALGDTVKRGTLLAELDSSTLALQAEQARRSLELARLQLNDADREAARSRTLAGSDTIAQATLDKAESAFALAQAQVAQGEASVAVIEDQLRQSRVLAPFAGTVTGLFIEEGEFFTAMGGMDGPPAVVSLDALDIIKVDLHIPDVDLGKVEAGMEVIVTSQALPGKEFAGAVALVGAAADRGARTFLVRVRIDNVDRGLKPGLFLTARLVLERREQVIVIDGKSLDERGEHTSIMVLQGDVAKQQRVTVGLRGDGGVEITGVDAGTEVLIDGQFGLPDGSTVRVIR